MNDNDGVPAFNPSCCGTLFFPLVTRGACSCLGLLPGPSVGLFRASSGSGGTYIGWFYCWSPKLNQLGVIVLYVNTVVADGLDYSCACRDGNQVGGVALTRRVGDEGVSRTCQACFVADPPRSPASNVSGFTTQMKATFFWEAGTCCRTARGTSARPCRG